mgnify:FL=1
MSELNTKKSFVEVVVTKPTTDFTIGFEFSEGDDVYHVLVDGIPASKAGYTTKLKNSVTIEITPAVPSGTVRIYRETDIDSNLYKFTAGALFEARTMDANFAQIRHSQQELRDSTDAFYRDTNKALADVTKVTGEYDAYAKATRVIAESAVKTANSATATANAATVTANAATTTANKASTTANEASTTAKAADATAKSAEKIVTEAQSTAGAANSTANAAKAAAEAASVSANKASTSATESKQLAEAAGKSANAAKAAADIAAKEAKDSATLAKEATDISLGLQAQINSAVVVANNASSTASGIAGTASAADTKATEALKTAKEAKGTADGIAGTANSALKKAEEALAHASATPMTPDDADTGASNEAHLISPVVLKHAVKVHAPAITNISGNAGTASKLATARSVTFSGGATGTYNFDGSTNVVCKLTVAPPTNLDATVITSGTLGAARIPTLNQSTTGNAATATKLATARTINGVKFDGTANITVDDSTKLPLTGGTLTGNLSVEGTITATGNVTAFSDRRLKCDLVAVEDSLSKIQSLTGYTYNRIDLADSVRYVGLIAQDVQSVIPEAVREHLDGTLSVDYMGLVAVLVQAIKELDARVKYLEGF